MGLFSSSCEKSLQAMTVWRVPTHSKFRKLLLNPCSRIDKTVNL